VDGLVVDRFQPRLEQPVHLRQVRDLGPVADLDQELLSHGPEEALDFASALGFPGPGVDQLYAQDAAAAQQPRVDEGTAVIEVGGPRDAAPLEGGAERRRHPHHVVVVSPAGAHDRTGVVVDEREQVRLPPVDDGAVESVLCRPRRYADKLDPAANEPVLAWSYVGIIVRFPC
jgi:hypothetical protein